jgi:hypothetical protein
VFINPSLGKSEANPLLTLMSNQLEVPYNNVLSKSPSSSGNDTTMAATSKRELRILTELCSPQTSVSKLDLVKKDMFLCAVTKSSSRLSAKDIKLSEFLQKNPDFFPPPQQKCTFKIRIFYIYTLLIIGVSLFFVVDPATATKTAKDMVRLIKLTDKFQEPWKFMLFSLLISLHQLFGVPLQTVTVALICFATKKFLYGYIVVCTNCIGCALLLFYMVRHPLKNFIEKNYRDNSFVQVIRAEACIAPLKVSFLFRFMYLPGMYKNLGLALSTINLTTYMVPAVIEICMSNTIYCMIGVMLREGFTKIAAEDPGQKQETQRKVVMYFSYILSGLQVICIIIALVITMMKMKKIRYLQKLLDIRLSRENMIEQGYIFDFETQKIPAAEMAKQDESGVSPEKTPVREPVRQPIIQVFRSPHREQSVVSINEVSNNIPDHQNSGSDAKTENRLEKTSQGDQS